MKRFLVVVLALNGCRTEAAPEPRPDPQPAQTQTQTAQTQQAQGGGQRQMQGQPQPRPVASVPVSPDDPVHGKFDLADATKGLSQGDKITATIDTTHGKLTCTLLSDKVRWPLVEEMGV